MNTKEILTIIALAALGLCLLCSLAKMAMKKGDKGKKHCDKVCGAFVFLAIILLAVSQLLGEGTEKYDDGKVMCTPNDGNCEIGSDSTIPLCMAYGECNNASNCCSHPLGYDCRKGVNPPGFNPKKRLPCCKSCCDADSPTQCFKPHQIWFTYQSNVVHYTGETEI